MTRSLTTRGADPFEKDATQNEGYLYTTRAPLSAQVANQRLTKVTLEWLDKLKRTQKIRTVLDLGCGDGTYTAQLAAARPRLKFAGGEPSRSAIKIAQKKYFQLAFFWCDLLIKKSLPKKKFDAVIIRGVIHHVPKPKPGVINAIRTGHQALIIEPNGWNPLVKLIEKISPYHRAHGERSFTSWQLQRWVEQGGAEVQTISYVGLVPFFCPNWAVPFLKTLEPLIERSPVSWLLCGQVILEVSSLKKT